MAYNPNFQWRRKTITISVPTSSLPAGYQVKLIIPKETEMQSDFRDLRFETTDGYGLSYWLESIVSNTATVWVKLKDAATIGITVVINMYYGNPYVKSVSNGTNTFDLFDDFSTDLSKWVQNGVTITSGYADIATTGTAWTNYMYSNTSFNRTSTGYILQLDVQTKGSASNNNEIFIGFGSASAGSGQPREAWYYNATSTLSYMDAASSGTVTTNGPNTNTWYTYNIRINSGSGGLLLGIPNGWNYTLAGADNNMRVKINPYLGGARVDNVLVRKYVATEPATPTIGSTATIVNWNPQRKAITINTTTATPANYQVKLTIPFSPEMNIDFSDLRFVSKTNFPLDYWIESSTPGVTTDIWVKLADAIDVSSSDYIYMHYGNPNLTSVSNGTNTFELFDGARTTSYLSPLTITTFGHVFESLVRRTALTQTASPNVGFGDNSTITPSNGEYISLYDGWSAIWYRLYTMKNGSIQYNPAILTPTYNNTTVMRLKVIYASSSLVQFYRDGLQLGSNVTSNIPTSPMGLYIYAGDGLDVSWSFIRKYIATEPTFSIGSAEPMNSFSYRKPITINNNSGSALTDYQIPITVAYSSHMQSNFNDIRFVDISGNLLPYWIESKIDSSIANVWIKVNLPNYGTSPTGDNTVYMYYGNPDIPSASDGTNTFTFFDDFNGNLIDTSKWVSTSGVTQSGGILTATGSQAYKGITSKISFGTNYSLRSRSQMDISNVVGEGTALGFRGSQFVNYTTDYPVAGMYNTYSDIGDGLYESINIGSSYVGYHIWEIQRNSIANIKFLTDNIIVTTHTTRIPSVSLPLVINSYHTGKSIYSDWVLIRKYVSPEPTISGIGTEEISSPANITATNMIITPSDSPCISGSCTVTVDVTWTNTGGTSESFTPSIKIDNVPVVTDPVLTPVSVGPSLTASQQFIITGMTIGTHSICPDPN